MSGQSHDDGFREIHLSGKQLVFLFMAATVVLVVTFLTGVLVGRGVRAERTELAQEEQLTLPPETTPPVPPPAAVNTSEDPRAAAPPPEAEDDADGKAPKVAEADEPPRAVVRNQDTPPAPAPPSEKTPVADVKPAPAKAEPAKAVAAKVEPSKPEPAKGPAATGAPGNGYAVQVAAVNARSEADAIVKRLSGKGYAAYVESPKGSASVFRVRVGTFKTRRDAQTVADKLKKEEKFKPWVTR